VLIFADPWRCRRDYFEIPWSNVRIPVDPDLINNTTLPLQVQAMQFLKPCLACINKLYSLTQHTLYDATVYLPSCIRPVDILSAQSCILCDLVSPATHACSPYFVMPQKPVTPSLGVCAQDVPKVGRVVHASAISVSETEVRLDNGSSLPFDYLVLASGSTWDDPVNSGTDPLLTDRKLNQQASCPM